MAYLFWFGCQKCILGDHGNVLKRFSFFNWIFFKRFPALCRNLLLSSSISSAKLSKLHSTCPLKLLNKFYLLIFFFYFGTMIKKQLDFFRKLHWQGSENCSLHDHRKNLRKKKFFELSTLLFHFQKTSERNVSVYWQKIFSGLWNCVLLVHRNILKKNLFCFKSMNFYHFQTKWINLAFSCRNWKTCILPWKFEGIFLSFTRPLDVLEEKPFSQLIIFRQFRKVKKPFGLLPKFYRELCQNCILCVQRNILCIYFFLFSTEVIFLNFFQYLSEQKIFRPSDPKFRLFSKIAFYLSIKIFVEKLFFLKKFYEFLSVLDIERKVGLLSIFLTVLSTLHFMWP